MPRIDARLKPGSSAQNVTIYSFSAADTGSEVTSPCLMQPCTGMQRQMQRHGEMRCRTSQTAVVHQLLAAAPLGELGASLSL